MHVRGHASCKREVVSPQLFQPGLFTPVAWSCLSHRPTPSHLPLLVRPAVGRHGARPAVRGRWLAHSGAQLHHGLHASQRAKVREGVKTNNSSLGTAGPSVPLCHCASHKQGPHLGETPWPVARKERSRSLSTRVQGAHLVEVPGAVRVKHLRRHGRMHLAQLGGVPRQSPQPGHHTDLWGSSVAGGVASGTWAWVHWATQHTFV